ncbi:MAG: hypothetical protein AAGF57_06920 [Pseudomonadota bacterium]
MKANSNKKEHSSAFLSTSQNARHFMSAELTGAEMSSSDFGQILQSNDWLREDGVAVYIHLPFCTAHGACFGSGSLTPDDTTMDRYLSHIQHEMEQVNRLLQPRPILSQLHLGGGTPNYLSEPQLIRLMGAIEANFTINAATELSLDASARRSSLTQLELLKGLGFRHIAYKANDLSASVEQTFGRLDSFEILRDAFNNTREAGLETISMDLAYGLPEQSMADIKERLRQIKELSPDRVSCHSYTANADALRHHSMVDPDSIPSLADRLVMFNSIVDFMQSEGYDWIGLDYFAKSTDAIAKAHQQHHLHRNAIGYNTHGCPSTLGFGTRAVSDINHRAVAENHNSIEDWSGAIQRKELPIHGGMLLSEEQASLRQIIQDLFCNLQVDDYSKLAFDDHSANKMKQLEDSGVLEIANDKAVVTAQGRFSLHHTVTQESNITPWLIAI